MEVSFKKIMFYKVYLNLFRKNLGFYYQSNDSFDYRVINLSIEKSMQIAI